MKILELNKQYSFLTNEQFYFALSLATKSYKTKTVFSILENSANFSISRVSTLEVKQHLMSSCKGLLYKTSYIRYLKINNEAILSFFEFVSTNTDVIFEVGKDLITCHNSKVFNRTVGLKYLLQHSLVTTEQSCSLLKLSIESNKLTIVKLFVKYMYDLDMKENCQIAIEYVNATEGVSEKIIEFLNKHIDSTCCRN